MIEIGNNLFLAIIVASVCAVSIAFHLSHRPHRTDNSQLQQINTELRRIREHLDTDKPSLPQVGK